MAGGGTHAQAAARAEAREMIMAIIADHNDHGGAGITDFGPTGRSIPMVRKYLADLRAEGLIERNQFAGPGTRYFLANEPRARYWAIVVNDLGAVLGEVELPERLADVDGASDRRTVAIGQALSDIMRAARDGES